VLAALDAHGAITDNSHIDRLQTQIAELQASRQRLLVSAAADRRRIERDLHEGVQQQLVALSVQLQLAGGLINTDPAAATVLLGEMTRDVKQALDDTTQLALRIYPPLDAVGLATTMRSAAVSAGVRASVDVVVRESYSAEVAAVLYWSWLDLLDRVDDGYGAALRIREDDGALSFELEADSDRLHEALEALRDRIEALGGCVGIQVDADGRTRVHGSVPAE
jgi:glucose-6-phosphate-specific signal transduction histidine kinase